MEKAVRALINRSAWKGQEIIAWTDFLANTDAINARATSMSHVKGKILITEADIIGFVHFFFFLLFFSFNCIIKITQAEIPSPLDYESDDIMSTHSCAYEREMSLSLFILL